MGPQPSTNGLQYILMDHKYIYIIFRKKFDPIEDDSTHIGHRLAIELVFGNENKENNPIRGSLHAWKEKEEVGRASYY